MMQLHIFGTRGSFPTFGEDYREFGHDTSCYVLRDGDYGLILDCGSGLVHAAGFLSDCTRIDVLLSHVHYDHILGLFDIGSFFEDKTVRFFGEFSRWFEDERRENPKGTLYRLEDLICGEICDITLGTVYSLSNGFQACFTRSLHPNHASMIEIRHGEKRLCFTGDYEHQKNSGIVKWAKNCDLLLFDGSYNSENYPKFKSWGHSTWESACQIARDCGAGALIITHHASHSTDNYLEIQERAARALFRNVTFARQGSTVEI